MPAKPKRPAAKKAAKKVYRASGLTGGHIVFTKRDEEPAAPAKPPTPKQARVYPSLQVWLSQPDNVARLQQILADPVFVAACHYVEGTLDVTPDDLVGTKAVLGEVLKRKTSMAVGMRSFATIITSLPGFVKKDAAEIPQPWEHIQAPIR